MTKARCFPGLFASSREGVQLTQQGGHILRAIDIPAVTAGHSAPITSVALRGDGRLLATGSYDGTAMVWEMREQGGPRPLVTLPHRRLVNAVAWNPARPGTLATASADKTAVVWELAEGHTQARIVSVLARHTDDINSVAWLPDGRRLACVSEDGGATMWDALDGRFLDSLASHAGHAMMVACSRDGLVATVGEDGMVTVIDPGSGVTRARDYPASVEGCAWSHSGRLLAVARDDGLVDVLDRELAAVRSIPVSSSAARSVAWSDDDEQLVIGAYDGSVHFADTSGRHLGRIDDDRMWPRSVTAARGLVAVGSFRSAPFVLDQGGHAIRSEPAVATHGPNAITVRDGRQLVIGCDSGLVACADVAALSEPRPVIRVRTVTRGPILSLATGPGQVAVGTYSGQIGAIGDEVRLGKPVGAPVPSILHMPDVIIGGSYGGELIVVDPRRLEVVHREQAHDGSVKALAALDGEVFVSCATDRSVAIGTLTERRVLWEHGNLVNSVAVLGGPGQAVVASASRDHTVKVGWIAAEPGGAWRVSHLETLIGPDESVKCVGLLGDPRAPVVLAGSYDFGLYAWNVEPDRTRTLLRKGRLVSRSSQGLSCIGPVDARTVAVAGWDGQVSLLTQDGHEGGEGGVREVARFSVPDAVAEAEGRTAR
jgi:toxoflavin biosynthesis protein ToxC